MFGNGILPENCPNQIFACFALSFRIGLGYESAVCRIQILACGRFSLHPALREHHQRPTHTEMVLPGHALDHNYKFCRNGNTLADG